MPDIEYKVCVPKWVCPLLLTPSEVLKALLGNSVGIISARVPYLQWYVIEGVAFLMYGVGGKQTAGGNRK